MKAQPQQIQDALKNVLDLMDPETTRASDEIKEVLRDERFRRWYESWIEPEIGFVYQWTRGEAQLSPSGGRRR